MRGQSQGLTSDLGEQEFAGTTRRRHRNIGGRDKKKMLWNFESGQMLGTHRLQFSWVAVCVIS